MRNFNYFKVFKDDIKIHSAKVDGFIRYTWGDFYNFEEALKILKFVKSKGFRTSFVMDKRRYDIFK